MEITVELILTVLHLVVLKVSVDHVRLILVIFAMAWLAKQTLIVLQNNVFRIYVLWLLFLEVMDGLLL